MNNIHFHCSGLGKVFNRNTIFQDVAIDLKGSQSLVVTGRNGSGKTTLLKILAGVLSPTTGTLSLALDGKVIEAGARYQYLGFVAPYLQMYEEFTAEENLRLSARLRGLRPASSRYDELLTRVGLGTKKRDFVRTYSSGMKQRLKYACAILHGPQVLILDEPTANLDVEGKAIARAVFEEQRQRGIAIVATNEPQELAWSTSVINLDMRGQNE